MQRKEIDNRGLACPQPVVNTKKALAELAGEGSQAFMLTVIVDNEAAKENVSRYARAAGHQVSVEEKEDGTYIFIQNKTTDDLEVGELSCGEAGQTQRGTVFLITSATLGQGSEELGKILMRSFIFALKEGGVLPAKMLFLNSGVFLTTEGSPVLDELKELAARGTEVFSCGTCLDFYQLKEKLQVGQVTNMYDTVENISSAAFKCITL